MHCWGARGRCKLYPKCIPVEIQALNFALELQKQRIHANRLVSRCECTLEVATQTESPFHPWHCSGNNQSWLRRWTLPSRGLGKLLEHRSLWLPSRELQQAQARQISQETGGFLTPQLVEAVLVLPLGAELCLSTSHR